ncbi:type II toxin-antitoxin system VapC family toxin [Niabella aquatica]
MMKNTVYDCRVFLDANVVLDLMFKRNSYNHCEAIFECIHNGLLIGFVTPSVLQITSHWLTKAFGAAQAKSLLLSLLEEVEVIEVNKAIFLKALQMKPDDIEDNIQLTTAAYYHLDYFITNDAVVKKQKWDTITILSPENFIKLFKP